MKSEQNQQADRRW